MDWPLPTVTLGTLRDGLREYDCLTSLRPRLEFRLIYQPKREEASVDTDQSPKGTDPVGDRSPSADIDERPELFVLLISAIGTPVNEVQSDLDAAFRAVGYAPRSVRISELLDATALTARPPNTCPTEWFMDLGDRLREESGVQGAAAMLAVLKIRADRAAEHQSDEDANVDRPGTVTIIRSAKRAEEVDFLRNIYGSRLLVIGISQSEEKRRETLVARLGRERDESDGLSNAALADRLLRRDEQDPNSEWGQSLQKAFGRADAFLWIRSGHQTRDQVTRLVELWFQQPFTTPTPDEQGMYHASASKYRSAAAGRQVGVAVIDEDGEVLVTGTNEVPKPGGGQFWPDDTPDHRDFKLSYETNDVGKRDVIQDLLRRLRTGGWLSEISAHLDNVALVDAAIAKGGHWRMLESPTSSSSAASFTPRWPLSVRPHAGELRFAGRPCIRQRIHATSALV